MRLRAISCAATAGVLLIALANCGGGGQAAATQAGAAAQTAGSPSPQAGAAAQQVSSINLSPTAVKLSNPPTPGSSGSPARIKVSLQVTGQNGQPVRGKLAQPIRLAVYGPSPAVLTAETPVIRAATGAIYFRYNGRFVANPVIVTAVSGHAFALMSFQPRNRGFPGSGSVTFPMSSRDNIARGWGMEAAIGGGPEHFVEIDTGSRGLVVPASALGRSAVGPGPEGKITYTSDGKEFLGHYYLAPLTLRAGGATVTTVPIRVLGVDRSACAPGYPNCRAGGISGLGVMGVGFDRGQASAMAPELTNAFLALTGIAAGSVHPGYIIRRSSVTLGITGANQAGFDELPLTSGGTGPGDWNTAPGCFAFPGLRTYPRQCGTVLVDTGIASAILGLPRSQRPPSMSTTIPDGTAIRIDVGSSSAAALSYGFTTGSAAPPAPKSIRWAGDPKPFVNTGRHPIAVYDYLFDDASGKLGFRRS